MCNDYIVIILLHSYSAVGTEIMQLSPKLPPYYKYNIVRLQLTPYELLKGETVFCPLVFPFSILFIHNLQL